MPHTARVARVADVAQRFGLVLMVGTLMTAFWVALAVFFSVQYTRLFDQAYRDLRLVNTAVAQHTTGLFRAMETDLRTLELWMQAHPSTDPLSDPDFTALVAEMQRASQGMINLRLVDNQGRVYGLPWSADRVSARAEDRDYFRAQEQKPGAPRQPYIGVPVKSRINGSWSIPVSWRLDPAVGHYVLVTCAVQLERLFDLHDRLRYRPDGTINLVRRDGILLSRTPFDARFLGRDVRQAPNFTGTLDVQSNGSNGTFKSDGSKSDGIARFGTYERLDDYPLTVVVSRSERDVLEPFDFRLQVVVATSALLSLAVIAFTTFLHRSQRALRRAQKDLHHLATVDSLTGTFNRRALIDIAEREFLRAQRFDRPLTVLALDLDHFKAINDRHGHATGDEVLKECTERWKRQLREQDVLGRLGGEEFCVLLAETTPDVAAGVAERLRSAVADIPMRGGQRITVSIGLCPVDASDEQWTDALERADRALYAAKGAGRDRVTCATSPVAPSDG
jgi:diguanylate cyclase (GGDEF)-like protein